jgi:hypothetical protein
MTGMPIRDFTLKRVHPELPFVLLKAAEVDAILRERLTELLQPSGFESVDGGRRWVRARPPLRDVFELMAMKGASVSPRWGLSLDFVPHVKGDSIGSHATNKRAVLDITFDPNDTRGTHFYLSTSHGAVGLQKDAATMLPVVVRSALDWFASADEARLVTFIEAHRRALEPSPRFKFENYPQHALALAFALMREGRSDEARATLEGALRERTTAKTFARLVALLEKGAAR